MKNFTPVYGPVKSWRYGQSLGIDPIGFTSTCSFNCVYCQLGQIERSSLDRQTFIPTAKILAMVNQKNTEKLDVITLSGSGEPTLALNLGEIILGVKQITNLPVIVLTNGSLLGLASVQSDLGLADEVSVKLDGITTERVSRINRPAFSWNCLQFFDCLFELRRSFIGKLTVQTMLLSPWRNEERETYIEWITQLQPDGLYLNIPLRPKPISRIPQGRENLTTIEDGNWLKPLSLEYLYSFSQEIKTRSGVTVRYNMGRSQ